jgi:hypothetical protein
MHFAPWRAHCEDDGFRAETASHQLRVPDAGGAPPAAENGESDLN